MSKFYKKGHPGTGFWKFVRVNDEYRFVDANSHSHTDAVSAGEVAESAGTVGVNENFFRIYDTYSMTLGIGIASDDEERLAKLFNVPMKSKWERDY